MTQSYKVDGMTCGGCAASVEKAIRAVNADLAVSVDLEAGRVTLSGSEAALAQTSEAAVEQAVEDAGFDFGGRIG